MRLTVASTLPPFDEFVALGVLVLPVVVVGFVAAVVFAVAVTGPIGVVVG